MAPKVSSLQAPWPTAEANSEYVVDLSAPKSRRGDACSLEVARSIGCQWEQGRTASREDADAAHGDRGSLSTSAHDEAGAGPQDLSLSAAPRAGHAAEPGVGDGHHVRAYGEGLRLAVVLDWFSRRVLSWRVSITMEASFCKETLEEAMVRHGKSEIFNTDQGSQFTCAAFTDVLHRMRSGSAWTAKELAGQCVRRAAVADSEIRGGLLARLRQRSDARASIGRYLDFYNHRRPHSSLDGMTPDRAYFGSPTCCQSAWQPNPGRGSTRRSGKTVRTSGATSPCKAF